MLGDEDRKIFIWLGLFIAGLIAGVIFGYFWGLQAGVNAVSSAFAAKFYELARLNMTNHIISNWTG
jgi:hypothetical protein